MFSVITQYSTQFISLLSIVVLARLLTPAEIGVYAVAASVAFIAMEMRTFGVGQYLVREAEICDEKIRSATGLMMLISWGLAVIIALAAPFVADFYNNQALIFILWIIASAFVFSPFASVTSALLTRDMQFHSLFVVRITSSVFSTGSTIGFVLLGYSYYGLAMGVLVGAIVEVIILSYYRPSKMPWLPSFSKLADLLHFGVFTSTANTLRGFSISIPDLVLGRVASMADVGLFSRGLGVVVFLNKIMGQAVSPVVLPHLSEVRRNGGSVGEAYLRAITLLGAFTWPLFAVVNLCSYSMIRALFGDQWDAAIPIASVLAIWAILQSTHSFSSLALLAVDKEKLMFRKEVVIFIIRLISVIVAAPYGMLMIAWSMVFSGVVELTINSWVIRQTLGISIRRLFTTFLPNIAVTAACWCSLKLLGFYFDLTSLNPWLSLLIVGVAMAFVWIIALRLTKHEALNIILQMFGISGSVNFKR